MRMDLTVGRASLTMVAAPRCPPLPLPSRHVPHHHGHRPLPPCPNIGWLQLLLVVLVMIAAPVAVTAAAAASAVAAALRGVRHGPKRGAGPARAGPTECGEGGIRRERECVCVCMWLWVEDWLPLLHTRTDAHTHRHTDAHTHTQTHRRTHTHTDTHTDTHRHTHTHTRTHTHTHTHRRTHTLTASMSQCASSGSLSSSVSASWRGSVLLRFVYRTVKLLLPPRPSASHARRSGGAGAVFDRAFSVCT